MGKTARIDEPSINGYQAGGIRMGGEGNPENEFLGRPDKAAKTLYRFVVGMRARSRSFSSPVDENGKRGRRAREVRGTTSGNYHFVATFSLNAMRF